jgi:hypothetical protein
VQVLGSKSLSPKISDKDSQASTSPPHVLNTADKTSTISTFVSLVTVKNTRSPARARSSTFRQSPVGARSSAFRQSPVAFAQSTTSSFVFENVQAAVGKPLSSTFLITVLLAPPSASVVGAVGFDHCPRPPLGATLSASACVEILVAALGGNYRIILPLAPFLLFGSLGAPSRTRQLTYHCTTATLWGGTARGSLQGHIASRRLVFRRWPDKRLNPAVPI